MSFIKQLCLVLVFASLSSLVGAQTMFKCTQANGKIAFQAEPCPDNANEQVLKASRRGDVKVVQPTTHNAEDENLNATPPTGMRSSDDAVRSNTATSTDRSYESGSVAVASPDANAPVSGPKKSSIGEVIGLLFILLLFVAFIFASIWLIVVAFNESVMWGVLCIIIPLVQLIFAATHWDKAKKPFLISLSCLIGPILWAAFLNHGHH